METLLHRQLKQLYAGETQQVEVACQGFRIDAVRGGELIEIQHGSLAAIRSKIAALVTSHPTRVVKPIVLRKRILRRCRRGGPIATTRWSPKRGQLLDVFEELVHLVAVFPHPNLRVDVPLIEIEEWRYPGHGRRHRWHRDDFQIEDQRLLRIVDTAALESARDLVGVLPRDLHQPFNTAELAQRLGVPRWMAQKITYCLRMAGAARTVGKVGNAWLYELAAA